MAATLSKHLPDPDPTTWPRLAAEQTVTLQEGDRLLRIYASAGKPTTRWWEFRRWGPTAARFDHHPDGPSRLGHSVWYAALETPDDNGQPTGLATVLAERFQDTRTVPARSRNISLAICNPAKTLTLLNLEPDWLTQAGGNAAIASGPRHQSRKWARAIRHTYPRIDGLIWQSSVFRPGVAIVLWDQPRPALAPNPLLNRPLADIATSLIPVVDRL